MLRVSVFLNNSVPVLINKLNKNIIIRASFCLPLFGVFSFFIQLRSLDPHFENVERDSKKNEEIF